MSSLMSPNEAELREALAGLAAEPSTRFLEVRGPAGLDLRCPLDDLMDLIRSLEENVAWLSLERDKALAAAAEEKSAAKEKTRTAGLMIAELRRKLRDAGLDVKPTQPKAIQQKESSND